MSISFNPKPRKEPTGYFSIGGGPVVSGPNLMRNSEVQDAKRKTQERSCFKACRSCGTCAESRRDSTYPKNYDANASKWVDCRACEPFRFHDCHNGWMRDSYGEAEPFTEDALKYFAQGGRPLI